MNPKKRIPIKEVALAAQVSTQTVSRVMNNRPDVSPETRQRVLEIVEQLGYRPSRAASALRGNSKTIGAVGSSLENYGPSHTLMGINNKAKQSDYSIVLELVQDPEELNIDQILDRLFANHIEGIVWGIPQIGDNMDAIADYARHTEIPIVFTDIAPTPNVSMITIDNFMGGQLATQHLIAQGHTAIGLITGPLAYHSARERVRGWRHSMLEHGLPADDSLIAEATWAAESGVIALRQILDSRPDVTAIFASNDQIALGVFHAAAQLGLRIPTELAVVGYDDIPEAAFFSPSLTSVHQDLSVLGARAVTEVIRLVETKRMRGNFETVQATLPPELVIRASSTLPTSPK